MEDIFVTAENLQETKRVLDLCRLCLGKMQNMYSISSTATNMIAKIKYCTGLQIYVNDGYPQTICVICYNHVNIAHRLKNVSLLSDKKLTLLLKERTKCEIFKYEPSVSSDNVDLSIDELDDEFDESPIDSSHTCSIEESNHVKIEVPFMEHTENEEIKRDSKSLLHKTKNPNPKTKYKPKKKITNESFIERNITKPKMVPGGEVTKKVQGLKPETDEFKCGACSLMFKTKAGLSLHVFREHEDKMVCEVCGKEFRDIASLTMHKQCHKQNKLFACPYCEHKSNYKSNLNQHIMIHKGEKRYKCEHCPAAFFTAQDMRRHFNALHNPNVSLYPCEHCGKQFAAKYKLKRHFNRVHSSQTSKSETPQQCDICHHVLASRGNYRRHMTKVHKLKVPPRYPKVAVIVSSV